MKKAGNIRTHKANTMFIAKKILLLILLVLSAYESYAQNYVLEFDVNFYIDGDRRRYYSNAYYFTANNSTATSIPEFNMHREKNDKHIYGKAYIPASKGPIVKFHFENSRQVVVWGVWNNDGGHNNIIYSGPSTQTEFRVTNANWGIFETQGSRVVLNKFIMYPDLQFNSKKPISLPFEDKVTIVNTAGFPKSVYQWKYSLDGNNWNPVPQHIIDASANGVLTISSSDLFSEEDVLTYIRSGRVIHFQIYNRIQSSAIVSLPLSISSPHIQSSLAEMEQCNQSGDGKIKLTFNRPLREGEMLQLICNGIISESNGGNVELDATNSCVLTDLEAGTYDIELIGTYYGIPTYTSGTSHKRTVTIAPRPIITHSATIQNINCYGGTDGVISLVATGGTFRYVAELWNSQATTKLKEITFANTEPGIFSRLLPGTYQVRLRDTNGCVARKSDGTELIHLLTLTQPQEAVTISTEQLTAPLAYNSSDGRIIIRISGGTPASNGYKVTWRNRQGQTFSSTSSSRDGADYLYTLDNIPGGDYWAIVEDSRYNFLVEEDKGEYCGCSSESSIVLSAPPKIEVSLVETHFINCYGSDEGQITAHAKGGVPHATGFPYTYTWYKISDTGVSAEISQPNDSVIHNLIVGKYRVKITDANRIDMLSDIYNLVQPDSLQLTFDIKSPECSSGTGRIKAIASGGTPPYSYAWNKEGETNSEIAALSVGNYMLRVTDSRGCAITKTAVVTSPSSIQVDTVLTHPTCFRGNNGAIELIISGATPPYSVRWKDTGSTAVKRENLLAGTYEAIISDDNGCTIPYIFTLKEPKEMIVTLEEDFTLCKDQSRTIKALTSETNLRYNWTKNGTPLTETTSEITISRGGIYRVIITNTDGCNASAQMEVKESQTEFPLEITIPSSATVGSDIHAVNISKIKADRMEWQFPQEAAVQNQDADGATFVIAKPGIYTIRAIAYKSDCSTIMEHNIEIFPAGEITLPDGSETLIRQFLITPNPTDKDFKVLIELKSPEDFTLLLYSSTGALMDKKEVKQSQSKVFEYELRGDVEGTFFIHLITRSDKSVQKIVKQLK